jgi:fimbrial chaperone protein
MAFGPDHMKTQNHREKNLFNPLFWLYTGLLALGSLFPSLAISGEFSVTPIMLTFDGNTKSGVITINNDEDKKLQVQMKAFEWTQDEKGQDQYVESNAILFFPKIMEIEKKEQRILRAGITGPGGSKEKTYRLFIQEIPEAGQKSNETQIRVAIRFGVPIFVKPQREEIRGQIDKIALGEGKIQTVVRNTGNSHFVIQSILIKGSDREGKETFSKELSGWYLLAGSVRSYETPLTREVCRDTAQFHVKVKTTEFTLDDRLDVDKSLCPP